MSTYLLTWNPNRWQWNDLQECIQEIEENGICKDTWSSGTNKSIQPGDRLFIMRLGKEPKGIFASGWAKSNVYEGEHWEAGNPDTALFIDMDLDVLLDPDNTKILSLQELEALAPDQNWTPQGSGISINEQCLGDLEDRWARHLTGDSSGHGATRVLGDLALTEGAVRRTISNWYERSPEARNECLKHYGPKCMVCDIDYGRMYGNIGKGLIQVHHVKPLSQTGRQYRVDPVKDLRPVCPNCHAIIHKKEPIYGVEELKKIVHANRGSSP